MDDQCSPNNNQPILPVLASLHLRQCRLHRASFWSSIWESNCESNILGTTDMGHVVIVCLRKGPCVFPKCILCMWSYKNKGLCTETGLSVDLFYRCSLWPVWSILLILWSFPIWLSRIYHMSLIYSLCPAQKHQGNFPCTAQILSPLFLFANLSPFLSSLQALRGHTASCFTIATWIIQLSSRVYSLRGTVLHSLSEPTPSDLFNDFFFFQFQASQICSTAT